MKFEASAGGIVFKKDNNKILWLIIQPKAYKKTWGFPKGHVGDKIENEKIEDAALREVQEEGGVKTKITAKIPFVSEYFYKRDGELIKKKVHYFLMEYISGNPEDHDHEVEIAQFVSADELLKNLTYKGDKEAFSKALELVPVA